jgi:hypothetical protein
MPVRAQEPTAPPTEPRAWLGVAAQYGRATGQFASYVRDGGGITGNLTFAIGAGGNVGLRLSGHGLIYGSQTRRYSLLPGISADVTTSNVIAGLMVGPQISAGSPSVRAYGFGGLGFNYFATTSDVKGSGTSTPFASTTNFDDITLALEAGGGLQLHLGGTTWLDFGARYLSNGRVNYVTRDGVSVSGNNLVVNPVNSEVTLVVYHLGVAIGLVPPRPRTPNP